MTLLYEAYIYYGILAIAILCAIFLRSAYLKRKALTMFASKSLLNMLCNNYSKSAAVIKKILILLGVGFIFFALARPQWGYEWQETKNKGIDIVFALDCSKSMNAADIKPDRLNRAKLAIEDIISNLDGDRIGLVAFSGQAFLQCPITLDYDSFRMSLEAVDTDLIQRGGTNISAAIDEAQSAFGDSTNHKIVVLFSDGEDLEANSIDRAKKAFSENVNIYTMGVGLSEGHTIPVRNARGQIENLKDAQGNLVKSKLDEEKLIQISSETGAFYSSLVSDGVDKVIEALKQIPKQDLEATMRRQAIDRFQIFLGVALIFLALESLIGTRKIFVRRIKSVSLEKIVPLLFFFLILLLPKEDYAENTAKEIFNGAVKNFEQGNISEASELYLKAIKSSDDLKIHSKAFHNLGCIDYQNAKSANEKLETQNGIFDSVNQIKNVSSELMIQGKELLKEGLQRAYDDKENNTKTLEDEQFQNVLKQGISQSEDLKKQSEEPLKNKNPYMNDLSVLKNSIQKSVKNFESANALNPELEASQKNLQIAKKISESVTEQETLAKDFFEDFDSMGKNLETLIEELKKLVRDKENENQDNQQDKQDKQDKQDNSEQNKSESDKSQNNQEENQQNKDDKSSEKNDSEQNKTDANSENQEQEKSDKSEEPKENSEQKSQSQNESNDSKENNVDKDEIASAQEEKEETSTQSESAQAQESSAKGAKEENANQAQASAQDYRKDAGVMTLREAMQLMDSEKENEKKLPFRGYGTGQEKSQNFKDW